MEFLGWFAIVIFALALTGYLAEKLTYEALRIINISGAERRMIKTKLDDSKKQLKQMVGE